MEEVLRDVNERVSSFMRDERAQRGRSIRTLARKLKIKRRQIKAWEEGRKSPPIREMFRVCGHYGKHSTSRCQKFVGTILDEKAAREQLQAFKAANQPKKIPAVIWAEAHQVAKAA
jgi:ribosome-binding protein aMBF1 (putative translation factor)